MNAWRAEGGNSKWVRVSVGFHQDVNIRLAVLNALHWDLAVPRDRLQVKVESGWVTLSGDVDREFSRTSAEAHARAVPGVAGVTNAVSVKG